MQEIFGTMIKFIDKYAEDFLEDGTKDIIINNLKKGDSNLALELLESVNKTWIKRTEEVGKFYLFTDSMEFDFNGNYLKKPFYKASYIDSLDPNNSHIPALRKIEPRIRTYPLEKIQKSKNDYIL